MRDGKVGSEQDCCCSGCSCPAALANCTLTVEYVGGTRPSPDPITYPQLGAYPGSANCANAFDLCFSGCTDFFLVDCNAPDEPLYLGVVGEAVIECDSCCAVPDQSGNNPGDFDYSPTVEGRNCRAVWKSGPTFPSADSRPFCPEAYDSLPTDITLTLDCTEPCGDNEFP
jgi:hypothetical protein